MTAQLSAHRSHNLIEIIRLERRAFAAKMRLARAVLGWSQSELGFRVGLTQRAIHKLEQGDTEPRRATVRAIEEIWREQNIEFEDLDDGGFRAAVRACVLERPVTPQARRQRAARVHRGVTAIAYRPRIHRA
jgi:transcriptional regulator with XRE-family HTH domain